MCNSGDVLIYLWINYTRVSLFEQVFRGCVDEAFLE